MISYQDKKIENDLRLQKLEELKLETLKFMINENDYLSIQLDMALHNESKNIFNFENKKIEIQIKKKLLYRATNSYTPYYDWLLVISFNDKLSVFVKTSDILGLSYKGFIKYIYRLLPVDFFNIFNDFKIIRPYKQMSLGDYGL